MKKNYYVGIMGFNENWFEDLEEAIDYAEKTCCYTCGALCVYNDKGEIVAKREWYGCMTDVELCDNPIKFGDSGYYDDWISE